MTKEINPEEPKVSIESAKEILELKRYLVGKCISIVQSTMSREMATMKSRTQKEQDIIGSLITVIESDLKNDMKALIQ